MCKEAKETLGGNNIITNAIDSMSITFGWTWSSSPQSVFSTTLDGSQRSPISIYHDRSILPNIVGDKCLQMLGNFLAAVSVAPSWNDK